MAIVPKSSKKKYLTPEAGTVVRAEKVVVESRKMDSKPTLFRKSMDHRGSRIGASRGVEITIVEGRRSDGSICDKNGKRRYEP